MRRHRSSRSAVAPCLLAGVSLLVGSLGADWVVPLRATFASAVAVASLGVALRGRAGVVLLAGSVGLVLVLLDGDDAETRTPGPAALRVRLLEPWQESESFRGSSHWSARVLARSTRQRHRVDTTPWRLRLRLVAERPPPGRELRVRGHLRAPARFLNGGWMPPGDWVLHVKSDRLVESLGSTGQRRDSARRHALERIETRAGPASPWYRALLLGDRSGLPASARRQLEAYGLAHLFAVSGLHLGIALATLGFVVGRRSGPSGLGVVLGVCGVGLWLVGARPSLVRASVMASLGALAGASGRRPWGWNLLGLAPLVLIALTPYRRADLGLHLSLAATAGILAAAGAGQGSPTGVSVLVRPLATSLRSSIGALAATAPWTLRYFSSLPLLSPLMNLLYVPLTAATLVAGTLCLLLPGTGEGSGQVMEWLVAPLEAASDWRPRPRGNLGLPLTPWCVVLWAGCLNLLGRGPWLPRGGLVVAASLSLLVEGTPPGVSESVHLTFHDVGQGDALSLRDGDLHLLVDGGGWRRDGLGVRVLLPALLAQGVRRIDLLVLSHADRDHCGGLVEVAARLRVRELWINELDRQVRCGHDLALAVEGQGGLVVTPRRGERRRLRHAEIEVLPGLPSAERANDRSLLLEVRAHGRRLWLLGDASSDAERRLVAARELEHRLDLLKIAHHGSRSSTSVELLEAARPRHAWIGVGRNNSYGHPAPTVLRRLAARRVRVWRTDHHGAVRLEIPPRGPLRFETAAHPSWP